jgi:hypothetical protein
MGNEWQEKSIEAETVKTAEQMVRVLGSLNVQELCNNAKDNKRNERN